MMDNFVNWYHSHKKRNNYITYSLLFIITSIIIFSVFFFSHKSFVWAKSPYDGLDQHFTSLMYYGEYLRNIFKTIFVDHSFNVPLWDFSIGYGADIITAFHYYALGDPLTLLSAFVPMQYSEYLYTFLILLRFYLTGVAFIAYCHYMDKKSYSTIIGALSYAFCGFSVYAGIRHPYFINPMIYLPFLLIGIEKIYQKKSPVFFILMIFISAISNFYFFYMMCVIIFIYAVFRFFHYYDKDYLRNISQNLFKFIGFYLIGVGMSAIIFIPVVLMFFNTARSQDSTIIPMFYSVGYYAKLFFSFFAESSNSSWTFTAFNVLSFFSLILMVLHWKENKPLFIGYLLLTIFLCFPIFGSLFNGFSYISNRWCFAYAFLVSYIIVYQLPSLIHIQKKEYRILWGLYFIEWIVIILVKELFSYSMITSLILIGIILLLLLLKDKINTNKLIISVCAISILSVQCNAIYKYAPIGRNYIKEFLKANQAYEKVTDNGQSLLLDLNDNEFYRFDKSVTKKYNFQNSSVISRTHPIGFYFSLGNGYVTNYFTEMKNLNILSSLYRGLDYRSPLLALSSTKYLLVEKKNKHKMIPYGFEKIANAGDENFDIYYNQNYLPLGYTYDSQISRNEYDQMHPLDKQKALLDHVVVENDIALPKQKEKSSVSLQDYKMSYDKNIQIKKGIIKVKKAKSSIKLSFNINSDQDVYLYMKDLMIKQQETRILTKTSIQLKLKDFQNSFSLYSPYASRYHGEKDYLSHIGYLKKGKYTLTITFEDKGSYEYSNIQILGQKLDDLKKKVNNLKEDILTNEKFENNMVSGDISLNKEKFLCLSIPYSKGWSAFVDGKEVELQQANTMYMGMMLDKGKHHIELKYTTPGLKIGSYISIASIIAFIVICMIYNRKGSIIK